MPLCEKTLNLETKNGKEKKKGKYKLCYSGF